MKHKAQNSKVIISGEQGAHSLDKVLPVH